MAVELNVPSSIFSPKSKIAKLPSQIRPEQIRCWEHRRFSNEYYGTSYSPRSTRQRGMSLLLKLHKENKLGKLVLDVGSSTNPLSFAFATNRGHVILCVDIALGNNKEYIDWRGAIYSPMIIVKGDVQDIDRVLQKQIVKELFKDNNIQSPKFDSVICSDILNYVNYQKVLIDVLRHMKQDSCLIIVNMAGIVAEERLASEYGVKSNAELLSFLKWMRLNIEDYDPAMLDYTDDVDTPQRDIIICTATKRSINQANKF